MRAGFLSFTLYSLELTIKLCMIVVIYCFAVSCILIVSGFPLFLPLVSMVFPLPSALAAFCLPIDFTIVFLVGLFWAVSRFFIVVECRLIRAVGPKEALWCDVDTTLSSLWLPVKFKHVVADFCFSGLSPSEDPILASFAPSLITNDAENYYEYTSLCWSKFILFLYGATSLRSLFGLSFIAYMACCVWKIGRRAITRVWDVLTAASMVSLLVISSSPLQLWAFATLLGSIANFLLSLASEDFRQWLYWNLTAIAVWVANVQLEVSHVSRKHFTRHGFGKRVGSPLGDGFRTAITRLAIVADEIGLPKFIRGIGDFQSIDGINSSLKVLKDLGWPVDDSVVPLDSASAEQLQAQPSNMVKFSSWLVGLTDWRQGVHQRKMWVDAALDPLRVAGVEYRRTEEYANSFNELESVARYFRSPRYDYPDIELEDVWFLVGDIFKNSKLTPFNYIIRKWEKKYGLGAFMPDPKNRRKKYNRAKFIGTIGYKAFKDLWRKTFEVAPRLVPVAAVSVKGEALPAKKWMADKVRTVIGSPISQYIMSTIWNYEPNHRFKWVETPIKVGMPLNGKWLSHVFESHSRCQHHVAGDMTAFDSTLFGKVLDIIKSVRKKGFEKHSDFERIAYLIDNNYHQVLNQKLGLTSTGAVYSKGTGLTTGHSSTSMDNSIALVSIYFMAWKDITGLSARDFRHFNELSCYGDDHILSYLGTAPASWNFHNIQRSMRKFGIEIREEASGPLSKIEFLSKFARLPTAADQRDFRKFLPPGRKPAFAIFHNKEKLVGKMTAPVKTRDPVYRLKRLLSYMNLTAHHPDVYEFLAKLINTSSTFKRIMANQGWHVPTYGDVIRSWYGDVAPNLEDETDALTPDEAISASENFTYTYGSTSWWSLMVGALAVVPDVINPVIFNYGYNKSLQATMGPLASWPMELVARKNGTVGPTELALMLRKTAYDFLDASMLCGNFEKTSDSTLLVRHWLFLYFVGRGPRWLLSHTAFTTLSRLLSNAAFVLNADVHLEARGFESAALKLFLVASLSWLHVPPWFDFVMKLWLPNLSILSDNFVNGVISYFWSSLPPNYADTKHHLKSLVANGGQLLLEASTGSGKSTSFVNYCRLTLGHNYEKIIVVVPRSSIVKTIPQYVANAFGMDASGCTAGLQLDQRAKVWYVTANEFLLHSSWKKASNLILIDECHIMEPAYQLLKKELAMEEGLSLIYMSATPLPEQREAFTTVPLKNARVWQIVTSSTVVSGVKNSSGYLTSYGAEVVQYINSLPLSARVICFIPTVRFGLSIADSINREAIVVSANSSLSEIKNSRVYLCTSVADVGLTLPDVDTVLTSDVGFTVSSDLQGSRPVFFKMSSDALLQRAGRTGRTNHGVCHIWHYNDFTVPDQQSVTTPLAEVFSLVSNGLPVELINKHYHESLVKLLGVDDTRDSEVGPFIIEEAINQLSRYRGNLEPLLRARLINLNLDTNTGETPFSADVARMGLIRPHSNTSTEDFLSAIIRICGLLGKRAFAGSRAAEYEESIRNASVILLGNVQSKLPFPDPDLGEWGMRNESDDEDY
jgi:hypothetical protein